MPHALQEIAELDWRWFRAHPDSPLLIECCCSLLSILFHHHGVELGKRGTPAAAAPTYMRAMRSARNCYRQSGSGSALDPIRELPVDPLVSATGHRQGRACQAGAMVDHLMVCGSRTSKRRGRSSGKPSIPQPRA
jgi:hypothetical protein